MNQSVKKGIGKNTKLIILLMVVISVITGAGMYSYLSTTRIAVYMFAADYASETPISEISFTRTEMDTQTYNMLSASGTKYASAEDIRYFISQNDVLAVPVAANTPMVANQAVSTGGTTIESRLGEYMVSVELQAETVSGLTSGIRAGSRINLLSGFTRGDDKETGLNFENLLVLEAISDEQGKTQSVYVEMDPADAVTLVHCLTYETVTANLIKPGSYIVVEPEKKNYKKNYTAVKATEQVDYWSNPETNAATQ